MAFGLIFDMDGVLFDSHPVHKKAWWELLRSLGRKITEEELEFIMTGATREEILQHYLGPLSAEQLATYGKQKEVLFRNEEEGLRTIEGVKAFLDAVECAAIPKVVATSASKRRALRMLDGHELTDRFEAVVTGDDVPKGKSDPAIFLRGAEELRVSPDKVLVFEDAAPAIKAAKSVGMKCIGIAEGARRLPLQIAGADLIVRDFRELCLSDISDLWGNDTKESLGV
jgi:HAD superfamily hydrolase (TIGR01509 family)